MNTFVVLGFFILLVEIKCINYKDYKVYEVDASNEKQSKILLKYQYDSRFNFLSDVARRGTTKIMVPLSSRGNFERTLARYGVKYSILIENIDDIIKNERYYQNSGRNNRNDIISFTSYNRYPQILKYVKTLEKDHSDIVSLDYIGNSTENRPLVAVKISSGGRNNNKPAILIDGGIHAREWIAPAVVLYIIQELVENPKNYYLIKDVDWHIIPVINPDGYEYSHGYGNRLWRKTRSRGIPCYGVDGNRNFDINWGEQGSSGFSCSDTYRGPKPFSEPETRALRDYVLENTANFKLYLSCHSEGQYLLYPWGYTTDPPENEQELQSLGEIVADAIKNVSGTVYQVGSTSRLLYGASGGNDDYLKAYGGIDLAYTIELPGGGKSGFDLPASRILPVVKETFEGIKAFHDYVKDL